MACDEGLAERVRSILSRRGGFSERKMFGGVCFMIDGHMCCGVTKTDLMLRLAADEVMRALRRQHTRPMDFTGKPMKSMIFVDAQGTDSEEALHEWVERAIAFVRTLPPRL
jgi:TfoX/Sxy family transcriptional regulator of competence genes